MKDTILIVDDDPIILLLVQRLLRDDGYELLTAKDGLVAQGILEKRGDQIFAVLLDWTMPQMTGIELLRWMKQQRGFENIPVIMQTAMDRPQNVKEGIDAGAFYYLIKPFQKEVLRSIVKAAVSDFRYKQLLLRQLKACENPFQLLVEGKFRIRTTAEAEYLAVRIANACPAPQKAMAVSELLFNAIEHGTLGLSYDEKTALIASGALGAEVQRRTALPENEGKRVEVDLRKQNDRMTVLIKDEGRGFDFAKYLTMDVSRVCDNHGRGIAIASASVHLEYIGPGNQVLVTIPFD